MAFFIKNKHLKSGIIPIIVSLLFLAVVTIAFVAGTISSNNIQKKFSSNTKADDFYSCDKAEWFCYTECANETVRKLFTDTYPNQDPASIWRAEAAKVYGSCNIPNNEKASLPVAKKLLMPAIRPPTATLTPSQTSTINPSIRSNSNLESKTIFKKTAALLIFDPPLESKNGVRVTEYFHWQNSVEQAKYVTEWFKNTSYGRVNYTIGEIMSDDSIPVKVDPNNKNGFQYSEEEYLNVLTNKTPHHEPDFMDYNLYLTKHSICEKFNNDEFQELWLFGGPWMGFYESRLAGPGAYWYNSPALTNTSCNGLLPIMGFNYERTGGGGHIWGHRMESIMAQVFGGWKKGVIIDEWDRFRSAKYESPDGNYSGCGSVHYPPNGRKDYDYTNREVVNSYCEDFYNSYPNNLQKIVRPIDCNAWQCTDEGFDTGYYSYWFRHLPNKIGVNIYGVLNDWWEYLMNPEKANQFMAK